VTPIIILIPVALAYVFKAKERITV
jgi:hypothetical protein